jgi:hypothetical protein
LNLYEVAPPWPIPPDTSSTIDVGVDALVKAGISEPRVNTEPVAKLARRLRSLARY